jgi:hypothetical protein
MVSIGSTAKLAGLAIGIGLAYVALKNAGGIGSYIGSTVGGGIAGGFGSLASSFNAAFANLGGTLTSTSAEQIANTIGATNAINIPTNFDETFSTKREKNITREAIGLSELFKNTKTVVNVRDRLIESEGNIQPISFAFDKEGFARTGSSGLGAATIAAQAALAEKYNIAVFDTTGAFSNVNGFAAR